MRLALLICFLATPALAAPLDLGDEGKWPNAFPAFCNEHPRECAAPEPAEPLNAGLWLPVIKRVNRTVNAEIDYRPEPGDTWTIEPEGLGDCDDYAITKRARLIEAGVPRADLRMAFVRDLWNELHVVLVVTTDEGEYVLDNQTDKLLEPYQTEHIWLTIQDADNPRLWRNVI